MAIITQGNFYSRQRKLNTILFTPRQKITARVAQKRFFRLGSTDCLEQDKDLERLRFIHEQLEEHGCTMPWMLHFTRFYLYEYSSWEQIHCCRCRSENLSLPVCDSSISKVASDVYNKHRQNIVT